MDYIKNCDSTFADKVYKKIKEEKGDVVVSTGWDLETKKQLYDTEVMVLPPSAVELIEKSSDYKNDIKSHEVIKEDKDLDTILNDFYDRFKEEFTPEMRQYFFDQFKEQLEEL